VEIVSGLTTEDILIVQDKIVSLKKKPTGTNPFFPFRGKKK
jgi:hypothetical protein